MSKGCSTGCSCDFCTRFSYLGRRRFLGLLGLGLAGLLDACSTEAGRKLASPPAGTSPDGVSPAPPSPGDTAATPPRTGPAEPRLITTHAEGIPPPNPGPPRVVSQAPHGSELLALTIDDGYSRDCVAAYVEFAQRTGIHLTFSPNGVYSDVWKPHQAVLRSLIDAGQVQIGNHTFHHHDLTRLSATQIRTELDRNEEWIESTFGITARPWYRPPYGTHDRRTDEVAGELGFTKVLMWNGSFGDSALLTPGQLMAQATRYLRPGTIMLGHANHMTVTERFEQIVALIEERGLQPVTLDEMFGTSRAVG